MKIGDDCGIPLELDRNGTGLEGKENGWRLDVGELGGFLEAEEKAAAARDDLRTQQGRADGQTSIEDASTHCAYRNHPFRSLLSTNSRISERSYGPKRCMQMRCAIKDEELNTSNTQAELNFQLETLLPNTLPPQMFCEYCSE